MAAEGTVSPGPTIAHGEDRSAEAPWSLSPRGDRPPPVTTYGPGRPPQSSAGAPLVLAGRCHGRQGGFLCGQVPERGAATQARRDRDRDRQTLDAAVDAWAAVNEASTRAVLCAVRHGGADSAPAASPTPFALGACGRPNREAAYQRLQRRVGQREERHSVRADARQLPPKGAPLRGIGPVPLCGQPGAGLHAG